MGLDLGFVEYGSTSYSVRVSLSLAQLILSWVVGMAGGPVSGLLASVYLVTVNPLALSLA